jgi:hypothetical protein
LVQHAPFTCSQAVGMPEVDGGIEPRCMKHGFLQGWAERW